MLGCRRACRDLGLDFDPAVQGEACRYSLPGGYEAAKALLERCPNLLPAEAAGVGHLVVLLVEKVDGCVPLRAAEGGLQALHQIGEEDVVLSP